MIEAELHRLELIEQRAARNDRSAYMTLNVSERVALRAPGGSSRYAYTKLQVQILVARRRAQIIDQVSEKLIS